MMHSLVALVPVAGADAFRAFALTLGEDLEPIVPLSPPGASAVTHLGLHAAVPPGFAAALLSPSRPVEGLVLSARGSGPSPAVHFADVVAGCGLVVIASPV